MELPLAPLDDLPFKRGRDLLILFLGSLIGSCITVPWHDMFLRAEHRQENEPARPFGLGEREK